MIPRKLELKNFLCYGETIQTIDFENYSLICLSGKNGNGKSALLDALTWALWGQARKVSGTIKADEGLIRLGQTRMMVALEFQINLQIYRVRREFAKTYGKPYATLDFEIFDHSSEKFVSLTDKTIKLTQEKIELTIGLDFETFINTAFLKQGQSNEFSKKTPKERKQILATILGLSKYEKLQQRALEEAKKHSDEKKLLLKLQEQDNLLLEQETGIHTHLTVEKKELENINNVLSDKQKELEYVEQNKRKILEEKQQYDQRVQETEQLKIKIASKQQALKTARSVWKDIHAKALRLPNIKKLEEERWALVKQEKGFIELQQKSLVVQEEILRKKDIYQKTLNTIVQNQEQTLNKLRFEIERKILAHKHLLETDAICQKDLTLLRKQQTETLKENETIELKLKQEADFTQKYNLIKAQFEKRRSFYQMLIQQGNHIKNELKELEQKKTVAHDQDNPACPLCQQLLTTKRKQYLSGQFAKQENFSTYRLQRLSRLMKNLKEILLEQHNEVQQMTKVTETYTQLHIKKNDLLKKNDGLIAEIASKEELSKLQNKQIIEELLIINQQKADLATLELNAQKTLTTHTEILTLTADIKKLEEEKVLFNFDVNVYQQVQAEVKKREQELQGLETIKQDLDKQSENKHLVLQLCRELKEYNLIILAFHSALKQSLFNQNQLTSTEKTIFEISQKIQEIQKLKESIIHKIGSLENELMRLQSLKVIQKERAITLKKIDDECEDSTILAQTFSKNGIQALLIEEAIPEVEEEANIILSQLTNNQSHIFMESLRDLKSGGVKETLDIKIADSIGIRPYEMFSGGEAFRIDFALRIAISKLLSRRAGTALQTLIIDEGFGSQDDEGLTHLMSALHTIQHDFAKVIIVSHLADFKDNFPVHFVIEKEATGSRIRIDERG